MSKIKKLFKIYLNPDFWIRSYDTNENVDTIVKYCIENDLINRFDRCYVYSDTLKIKIWTRSYPFNFGKVNSSESFHYLDNMDGLPSRSTQYHLKQYIDEKFNFSNKKNTGNEKIDNVLLEKL